MPAVTDQQSGRSSGRSPVGSSPLDRRWLPWIVILGGIVQLALLLTTLRPGAFFSGDGGVKLLMVRQFAAGRLSPRLELPDPAGLARLWESGLFPIVPPFAYTQVDGWIVGFPMPFPLLSTPFYASLGQSGLYVLPVLSILAIWILTERTLARLEVGAAIRAVALAALIFASPLTTYGAIFWEHAPAVFLISASLAILTPGSHRASRRIGPVLAGVLAGLAVWLRPEAMVAAPLLCAAAALLRDRRAALVFSLGALAAGLGLMIWNVAWYGSPVGIHAVQVVDPTQGDIGMLPFGSRLRTLLAEGAKAYSFGAVGLLGLALTRRSRSAATAGLCALATLAGVVAIAALVPNAGGAQWGPRYLLPLVPLLTVSGAIALSGLATAPVALRTAGTLVVAATLLAGVQKNTIGSVAALDWFYGRRVGDALAEVDERPERVVLCGNRYIAQEFASLIDRKGFLLLPDANDLPTLMRQLREMGHDRALLLASNEAGDFESGASVRAMRPWIRRIGRAGSYDLYSVLTATSSATAPETDRGDRF